MSIPTHHELMHFTNFFGQVLSFPVIYNMLKLDSNTQRIMKQDMYMYKEKIFNENTFVFETNWHDLISYQLVYLTFFNCSLNKIYSSDIHI